MDRLVAVKAGAPGEGGARSLEAVAAGGAGGFESDEEEHEHRC